MYYNALFLQIEFVIFFLSFWYILYRFMVKIVYITRKIRISSGKKPTETVAKIQFSQEKNQHLTTYKTQKDIISSEERERVTNLHKQAEFNIEKGEYDLAKNLIVEWLTIDKFHIELNLQLAGIYLLEKNYTKAEYIYKDLLLVHEEDFDILTKLAYVLSLQEKYDLAIEMYKQANDIKENDIDVVNMLANLYYQKEKYIDAITYAKIFLRENPRHIDMLILLAAAYAHIEKLTDALNTYKKILDISPYNQDVQKEVQKIEAKLYKIEKEFEAETQWQKDESEIENPQEDNQEEITKKESIDKER